MEFLETNAGADWLYDSAHALICGDCITAPQVGGKPVVLVEPKALWIALAEHLGAQEHVAPLLTTNREYPIEHMLCEILAGDRSINRKIYDLAIAAVGLPVTKRDRTALHGIAEALIRPHAEAYAKAWAAEQRDSA